MVEVLNIVLHSFWSFLGTLFLISASGWAIARIILAFRGIIVRSEGE